MCSRFTLVGSVSMLAIALTASPALAQASSTQQDPVAAAPATDVAQNSGEISDIIVTAERREQSAQKAAVAIDVVDGDKLAAAGVTNANDITKLVPSLTVTNGGGNNTSLYLRGVGNRTNNGYNDPAIAISYDGVYLAHPAALVGAAFYDLQRIEVLKGPQGILYGRNATGGAINIIPAAPELGRFGGGFDVSAGNYDAVQAQAYVNVPLGDTTAFRLAATRQIHDGYNRDGTSDQDVGSIRGQFLFEPSSDISLRVGADYTKAGGVGAGGTYLGNYTPSPAGYVYAAAPLDSNEGFNTAAANAYRSTLLGAPGFGFLTPLNTAPSLNYEYWGVNAELSVKTGVGKFTLIPAYRKTSGSSYFNGPAFNTAYNRENDAQYSLEARLAGSKGPVDYLLGGFYFHESTRASNEFNQEFVLPTQSYTQVTESWAAFGQLTAHITDRFRLTGGARYTHDHKDMNGLLNNFITFCGGLPPANLTPPASFGAGCATSTTLPRYPNFLTVPDTVNWLVANGWIAATTVTATPQVFPLLNGKGTILKTHSPVIAQRTFSRVTWKAGAEFDLTPTSLLYAKAETGYRAGGLQLAEGRSTYNPEYLDAYTIGSKNRFFDNRVQLNIEAFYWKYRDQQITYFTVDTSGTLISSNENAGRVTIKGFDVDAVVKPFHNTTLSGKVQYLDARYNALHLFTAAPRDNINCPYTLTGQLAGGQPVKDFNCSGKPAVFAPKWTVNLGAEQVVPLGAFDLVGNVNTAWRDDQYGGFEYSDFEHIPAYWTTDLNLSLRSVPHRWSFGAYILNLENKRRSVAPQLAPTGQAVTIYSAPRTYGIRLTADF